MKTPQEREQYARDRHRAAISRRDQIAQKIRKLETERRIQEARITECHAAVIRAEAEAKR